MTTIGSPRASSLSIINAQDLDIECPSTLNTTTPLESLSPTTAIPPTAPPSPSPGVNVHGQPTNASNCCPKSTSDIFGYLFLVCCLAMMLGLTAYFYWLFAYTANAACILSTWVLGNAVVLTFIIFFPLVIGIVNTLTWKEFLGNIWKAAILFEVAWMISGGYYLLIWTPAMKVYCSPLLHESCFWVVVICLVVLAIAIIWYRLSR